MYFETHAHFDDTAFDEDRDQLLLELPLSGVDAVIDPGCSTETTKKAQLLAHSYDYIYFAAGVHPEELDGEPGDWIDIIRACAKDERCVAIGEIGLDYYWRDDNKDRQKQFFRRQLELALELNLPVIIHDREAHGDCFEIVSQYEGLRGVFHCYSGSAETAKELLKLGWYLGFDGPVTFKNARKTIEVLQVCPEDKILIETDSPYMAPVPVRGTRNDSRNLKYICEKIAEIKGIEPAAMAKITSGNAVRLFLN